MLALALIVSAGAASAQLASPSLAPVKGPEITVAAAPQAGPPTDGAVSPPSAGSGTVSPPHAGSSKITAPT